MKIGVLSDAHGNIFGLNECLDVLKLNKVDKYIYLGYAVGYMTKVHEVISTLINVKAICVRGNHEEMLLGNLKIDKKKDEIYRIFNT